MAGIMNSTKEHATPSHEEFERKDLETDTPLHRVDKSAMESAKKAENTIKKHEAQRPINPNGMSSV